MSSGSAAFKAGAVAAVLLAMLVLPSFGRCAPLGPAPGPAPAPPVSCSECRAPLIPVCTSKSKCGAVCSSSCEPQQPRCDDCRARVSSCMACCDDGTCSCDCKINMDGSCRTDCYVSRIGCQSCQSTTLNQCMANCLSPCNASCAT